MLHVCCSWTGNNTTHRYRSWQPQLLYGDRVVLVHDTAVSTTRRVSHTHTHTHTHAHAHSLDIVHRHSHSRVVNRLVASQRCRLCLCDWAPASPTHLISLSSLHYSTTPPLPTLSSSSTSSSSSARAPLHAPLPYTRSLPSDFKPSHGDSATLFGSGSGTGTSLDSSSPLQFNPSLSWTTVLSTSPSFSTLSPLCACHVCLLSQVMSWHAHRTPPLFCLSSHSPCFFLFPFSFRFV